MYLITQNMFLFLQFSVVKISCAALVYSFIVPRKEVAEERRKTTMTVERFGEEILLFCLIISTTSSQSLLLTELVSMYMSITQMTPVLEKGISR